MSLVRITLRWLMCAVVVAMSPAAGIAGLDPSFSGDGVATTDIGTVSFANAIALQPDGKIVAGGVASPGGIVVVRHLPNGGYDPDFGTGGIVVTPPPGTNGGFFALALQSDGKIVVAGVSVNGSTESVLLIRYEVDGTLDSAFGASGMVVTTLAASARPSAVLLQPDQKILVAGTIGSDAASDVLVLRYETGGALDATFDGDGILTAELGPTGPDVGEALALQSDDKIVVGALRAPTGDPLRIALARFDGTGALDPAFGAGGVLLTSHLSSVAQVALQTDQKILIGGNGASSVGITVARFLTDGSPDTAFGTDGVFSTGTPGIEFPSLAALAFHPPDRIVIGGAQARVVAAQPLITTADGLLGRLANDGHTLELSDAFDLGDSGDLVYDVAVQPDGKIVGASAPNNDFTVIRYEPIVCGDGVISSTEACDDGNTIDGDGCDHNCQPTGCGNGVATAGEACDDGNTVDGDCCSATCANEAAGNACPSDANDCTDDVCNASGTCTHVPNTGSCDDGNPCTTDTCANGQCVGAAVVCPLCESCDTASGACVGTPRAECSGMQPWSSATLQIRDKSPDKGDAVQWKRVRDLDIRPLDLGDPTTSTQYALCLYDESQATPALLGKLAARQGQCGVKPCWKPAGSTGWKYQDKEALPDGIATMQLKAKLSGPGTLLVKGRGPNLPDATLPLPLPARVQLQATNGSCWEATYSAVGVKRSDAGQFRGTSD